MMSLRYWIWRRPCRIRRMGWSRSAKAVLAGPAEDGPDSFDGVEVGCVGRQVASGDAVVGVDERPHPSVLVDVQVVSDEDDRAAELLVGGDEVVSVIGPGEALAASALVVGMSFGPVDQAGAFAGFVAAQGCDGDAALGTAADPDDGSGPAFAPSV